MPPYCYRLRIDDRFVLLVVVVGAEKERCLLVDRLPSVRNRMYADSIRASASCRKRVLQLKAEGSP